MWEGLRSKTWPNPEIFEEHQMRRESAVEVVAKRSKPAHPLPTVSPLLGHVAECARRVGSVAWRHALGASNPVSHAHVSTSRHFHLRADSLSVATTPSPKKDHVLSLANLPKVLHPPRFSSSTHRPSRRRTVAHKNHVCSPREVPERSC